MGQITKNSFLSRLKARGELRKILDQYLMKIVIWQIRMKKRQRHLMLYFFDSDFSSTDRPWAAWSSELEDMWEQ